MARGNGPLSAEHEPYVVAEVRVAAGAGAGSDRAERDERFYLASQWQLMWRKFRRHRLAIVGGVTVLLFYGAGICAGFLSPNDPRQRVAKLKDHPPMRLRFVDIDGHLHLRPFVYRIDTGQDPDTWEPIFVEDTSTRYPVRWFSRGWEYRLWGLFPSRLHLFTVEAPGVLFLLGSDTLGARPVLPQPARSPPVAVGGADRGGHKLRARLSSSAAWPGSTAVPSTCWCSG